MTLINAFGNLALDSTLQQVSQKLPSLYNGRILIDGSGVIQPASVSSLPLPTGASTSLLQSSGNTFLSSISDKLPSGLSVAVGRLIVDGSEVIQPISASTLPLPTDAATSALQTSGNSTLTGISNKLPSGLTVSNGKLVVDGSSTTQPISASTLPLPTDAATSALQTSGNSTLTGISSKLPSGLTVSNGKLVVDGSSTTQPISASTLPLPTGAATSLLQSDANSSLTDITNKLPSGLTVSNGKLVVDGSSTTQPISASTLPLPTDAATSALQTSGNSTLTNISNKLPSQVYNKLPVIPANVTDSVSDNISDITSFTTNIAGNTIFQIDGASSITPTYAVFSLDPLAQNSESSVIYNTLFNVPHHIALGISLSQRVNGQEFSVEVISNETPLPGFTPVSISSISQTTTTLSVTTSSNHNLVAGQSICIAGVTSDSRLNYSSLVVASIPAPNQFTATAGPQGTITSLTVGPFNNMGTVYSRSRMGGAKNGLSMIFENTTVTNASLYVRSNSGDAIPTSTTANFIANHSSVIGTTASIAPISAAGVYGFFPTNNYDFLIEPFLCLIGDRVVDVASSINNTRLIRNQIVPNPSKSYQIRIRGILNPSNTAPIAKVVSASKSGSTTVTINTDVPHNLTTGDFVNVYGIRDTTNFANRTTATAVSSIVSPTSFTAVFAGSGTATSYGGYVSRVNGGIVQPGAIAAVAQSISRTNNIVTVIGSASWTGFVIGDYINLHGVYDTSGTYLNLDGPYRVNNISTTTLVLEPIGNTPTGANIASTNCGGAIIKRTDLRLYYLRGHEFQRLAIESYGGGYSRGDAGSNSLLVQNILQGNISTIANFAPLVIQPNGSTSRSFVAGMAGPTSNTDYSAQDWAAASGSGAVIANAQGLGSASTFDVNLTAFTAGSSTGLDVYLQESPDNGTTYYDIWQCETLTAVGRVRIPAIPVNGRRRMRWVNRGGAATTATVTVTAMDISTTPAKQVQWFDRTTGVGSGTAVLNTSSAAYDISGTKLISVIMFAGTATAVGTFQPWMSLDGTNWYAAGSATNISSTSANATVLPITTGMVGRFVKVICTAAGTSQVINAIHIYGTN